MARPEWISFHDGVFRNIPNKLPGLEDLSGFIFMDHGIRKAVISEIEINKKMRKQGIGRYVIKELEMWLKEEGVKVVTLNSVWTAYNFWDIMGYSGRRRRLGYLSPMAKKLNPRR